MIIYFSEIFQNIYFGTYDPFYNHKRLRFSGFLYLTQMLIINNFWRTNIKTTFDSESAF